MGRKLFILFMGLSMCCSIFACTNKGNDLIDTGQDNRKVQMKEDDKKQKEDNQKSDSLSGMRGMQINLEKAQTYGSVAELTDHGCILQKGIEENDEYSMPVDGGQEIEQDLEKITYASEMKVYTKYYESSSYEDGSVDDIKKNTFIYVFGSHENNSVIADQIVILRAGTTQ